MSAPPAKFKEYSFVFNKANFDELTALKAKYGARVFLILVCVKAREVCILKFDELEQKRAERENAKGQPQAQYQLLVALWPNKSFRVCMNAPGVKKTSLNKTVVNWNDFPRMIFDPNA